jgi:hypothetical protein
MELFMSLFFSYGSSAFLSLDLNVIVTVTGRETGSGTGRDIP